MSAIDFIEKWHNRASDLPVVWFPFTFLKPHAHQAISLLRLLGMTFCFGCYFNLGYQAKVFFQSQIPPAFAAVATHQFYFWLGFFIWFNLVTRFFWNRRAHRMSEAPTQ